MNFAAATELARSLDAEDALAPLRAKFDIPADVTYFDGNSLGPLTLRAREVLHHTIEHEWRERLIRSWDEDWLAMPLRVGNMIAPLIGALPDTVLSCDNTFGSGTSARNHWRYFGTHSRRHRDSCRLSQRTNFGRIRNHRCGTFSWRPCGVGSCPYGRRSSVQCVWPGY